MARAKTKEPYNLNQIEERTGKTLAEMQGALLSDLQEYFERDLANGKPKQLKDYVEAFCAFCGYQLGEDRQGLVTMKPDKEEMLFWMIKNETGLEDGAINMYYKKGADLELKLTNEQLKSLYDFLEGLDVFEASTGCYSGDVGRTDFAAFYWALKRCRRLDVKKPTLLFYTLYKLSPSENCFSRIARDWQKCLDGVFVHDGRPIKAKRAGTLVSSLNKERKSKPDDCKLIDNFLQNLLKAP